MELTKTATIRCDAPTQKKCAVIAEYTYDADIGDETLRELALAHFRKLGWSIARRGYGRCLCPKHAKGR